MNDPKNQPIDLQEQREWLIDHKKATGASWTELARRTGIAQGTISQFGSDKGYAGDEERIAQEVFRYRQLLAAQSDLRVAAPTIPGYVETPTSKRLNALLSWGQRGRIIVAAMGPGTGKTTTAENYRASVTNAWRATMAPSTAGVNNMQIEVLEALGERDAVGTPQKLSRRIKDKVRGSGGLLIIDEAQHLSEKSVEEIRSWHDDTGVGIALLGNESVIGRLEGGNRRAAYAQLYSRVGMRMVQNVPSLADADEIAHAWNVEDDKQFSFLRSVSQKPGGLRSVTMVLELGSMLAAGEGRTVKLSHLQDAWAQLSSRPLAA